MQCKVEECWTALGHLLAYMDARWSKDTLKVVLSRLTGGLNAEARHLVYSDLYYLDNRRYNSIVGGVGNGVAQRLITAEYTAEVEKMKTCRKKLLKHRLISVKTMGQMNTIVKLKRDYDWEIAVIIDVENNNEATDSIRQLANNAEIPIKEEDHIMDDYIPELPQQVFENPVITQVQEPALPWLEWMKDRANAAEQLSTQGYNTEAVEEDEDIDWQVDP
ncbi:hypothetical protein RchiOBHm_Chr2g0090231 [Rosa chinensis]|uniref:Uncharacterized protein n=1 Tax=Rosa chinensis TaxID=74649 RepID=A0A2P6RJD8_ROSCH|nr:uncharacterized protein LOC112185832 [Rosa chinensis]PRQ46548.1 hypothetical protein RchiOBHm_Chr2g0090231 [Rosa chinensis]